MQTFSRPLINTPFLLAAILLLTGCVSSQLQAVHDTYRSEFQAQLGQADALNSAENGAAALQAEQFPVTLSTIAAFRQRHPDHNNANKHLTVLEAMIYLQTKRYGHASLTAHTAAEMPGSLTTFSGGLTRDELLLRAMRPVSGPGLIRAWEILAPTDGPVDTSDEELQAIAEHLESVANNELAPEGDDGRLYLAATAALVRMKQMSRAIVIAESNDDLSQVAAIKKQYGGQIVNILAPHLLPHEKSADLSDATALSEWSIRYRYVRLYKIGLALSQTNP